MKLQGLSVIFCLIAVPIMLILSYYIQAQVDTIALQASYDTKLIDATHDAMMAFEINTANENLSSVSDALRSICTASTNIFVTSMNTSLGMSNASKNNVQNYVPAILMTLYDGYYIYSPTRVPVVGTTSNGQAVILGVRLIGSDQYLSSPGVHYTNVTTSNGYGIYTIDTSVDATIEDPTAPGFSYESAEPIPPKDYANMLYRIYDGNTPTDQYTTDINYTDGVSKKIGYKTDYVLKSYIPYAARYHVDNGGTEPVKDLVINYTLDNFLTVYGTIGSQYVSKSGYYSRIENLIVVSGPENFLGYGDEALEEYCANNPVTIDLTIDGETVRISSDADFTAGLGSKTNMKARSAIAYYIKSYNFSRWLEANLGNVKENNVIQRIYQSTIDTYGTENMSYIGDRDNQTIESTALVDFRNRTNNIFNPAMNPEAEDSTFSLHKRDVMKNSIQYNLNLAMTTYNNMSLQSFAVNLPVFSEEDWNTITSKISFVSFMQGFDCGLKKYNNYALISSTNNEFTVTPTEIYFVGPSGGSSGLDDRVTEYHRIDCPKLLNDVSSININELEGKYSSFVSKEVKYDKLYDKNNAVFNYDHRNMSCYDCIINQNYLTYGKRKPTDTAIELGYYNKFDFSILGGDTPGGSNENAKKLRKLYLIAIGKEREDLYKTNAIVNSRGVETTTTTSPGGTILLGATYGSLCDIDSIDITISNTRSTGIENPPVVYATITVSGYQIRYRNGSDESDTHKIINNQNLPQTLHLDFEESVDKGILTSTNPIGNVVITTDSAITYHIDSIMINYK